MKNIFFIGNDPRVIGGIESFGRYLKLIFPHMQFITLYKKLDKAIIYPTDDVNELVSNNIFFKALNYLTRYRFETFLIKKKLQNKKYEVVILNKPRQIYSVNIASYKIFVQHTSIDMLWSGIRDFDKDAELLAYCVLNIDRFVALSDMAKRQMNYKLGIPLDKIVVIRHSSLIPILDKPKKKNNKLIMLSRLVNSIKRFDLIIESMDELPDFELYIYGDGPDKEHLLELSNNRTNVFICGKTNSVKEVLDSCGVLVISSEFEGYPICGIEGMRRGLPLIVRNTFESANDLINENGILLADKWEKNLFCQAVRDVYNNFDEYSKQSLVLGARHDSDLIAKKWHGLIND